MMLVTLPAPARGSDTITRWDSYSESSNCGEPYTKTPYVSRSGWLGDSERILGPFGTHFGRTLAEVRTDLVWWTVPYSGGRRVQVNRAMLPDLKRVADNLAAEAAQGRVYRITSVEAFAPRTIGGSYQLSRHALGLAIDINPAQNPYRGDNKLITNMPGWFVDAWKDAGFCWGGDWKYAKDAMHFSWLGSGSPFSAGQPVGLHEPATSKSAFGTRAAQHDTEFSAVTGRYSLSVADATGNGAPDVVGVRPHPDGAVIDIASSTYTYNECSITRWFVPDAGAATDSVVFTDIDGDTGQDLVALSESGGVMHATVATRRSEFDDVSKLATGAAATSMAFAGADFDGDGDGDLWEATDDGRLRVWSAPGFGELIHESTLPSGVPARIAAGDRDGGDTPELYTLYSQGGGSRVEVLTLNSSFSIEDSFDLARPIADVVGVGAGDYDGDGRSDFQALYESGSFDAYMGNTTTGAPASRWFVRPNHDCEEEDEEDLIPLVFDGTFYDDDGSTFEQNIESIAAAGVTRGCNPPFKDRFCPEDEVKRETMAAFMVRALGLSENSHPGFVDVAAGGTFENDIGKLATAGITKGCNPPANDMFCPNDPVTREMMAAFLVRALDLSENSHPGFVDVATGSTFEIDIGKLATAGITMGCNPPANDMFCPADPVTREMMAAFLDRAGFGG